MIAVAVVLIGLSTTLIGISLSLHLLWHRRQLQSQELASFAVTRLTPILPARSEPRKRPRFTQPSPHERLREMSHEEFMADDDAGVTQPSDARAERCATCKGAGYVLRDRTKWNCTDCLGTGRRLHDSNSENATAAGESRTITLDPDE